MGIGSVGIENGRHPEDVAVLPLGEKKGGGSGVVML